MRGGLARVSGRFDRRQHADTHRPEQISFKIDSTDKNMLRATSANPGHSQGKDLQRGEKQQKSHFGAYSSAALGAGSQSSAQTVVYRI